MKIGVFYGSTTGDTEELAKKLGERLEAEVYNVEDGLEKIEDFELILLGSSTWGLGEIQEDWWVWVNVLKTLDLRGKKVGVFGTGDSVSYSETFANALAVLADAATEAGAKIVGCMDKKCYEGVEKSRAIREDKLIGLAVDQINQPKLTEKRVEWWIESLICETKRGI